MALKFWSFRVHLLSAGITAWATTTGLEDSIVKANNTFSLVPQALVIKSICSYVTNSVQRHNPVASACWPICHQLLLSTPHSACALCTAAGPSWLPCSTKSQSSLSKSKPHHTNLSCRPSTVLLISLADFYPSFSASLQCFESSKLALMTLHSLAQTDFCLYWPSLSMMEFLDFPGYIETPLVCFQTLLLCFPRVLSVLFHLTLVSLILRTQPGADKMPNDLSLKSGTRRGRRTLVSQTCFLASTHAQWHTCTHTSI